VKVWSERKREEGRGKEGRTKELQQRDEAFTICTRPEHATKDAIRPLKGVLSNSDRHVFAIVDADPYDTQPNAL
jgi:hypothetical protein